MDSKRAWWKYPTFGKNTFDKRYHTRCSRARKVFVTFSISEHWGLFVYLLFYVPFEDFAFIWRRHHYRWRAAKFRPMFSAQGYWGGRVLYRATPAVTRGLSLSGLIRRTAPFSRFLRHKRGCGGSILTPRYSHLRSRKLSITFDFSNENNPEDLFLPESSQILI
jgi:hypothetical protein